MLQVGRPKATVTDEWVVNLAGLLKVFLVSTERIRTQKCGYLWLQFGLDISNMVVNLKQCEVVYEHCNLHYYDSTPCNQRYNGWVEKFVFVYGGDQSEKHNERRPWNN